MRQSPPHARHSLPGPRCRMPSASPSSAAIADLIKANGKELAELLTREQGKTQSGLGANFEVGGAEAWTRVTAGLSLPVETIRRCQEQH